MASIFLLEYDNIWVSFLLAMCLLDKVLTWYRLTHWGRVTHICVSKLTIIGSDNDLSPGRRQAIIWFKAGILLMKPLGTNFSEHLIRIHAFSFKKMHLKMSSAKWRPFCLGLNVLKTTCHFHVRLMSLLAIYIYIYAYIYIDSPIMGFTWSFYVIVFDKFPLIQGQYQLS